MSDCEQQEASACRESRFNSPAQRKRFNQTDEPRSWPIIPICELLDTTQLSKTSTGIYLPASRISIVVCLDQKRKGLTRPTPKIHLRNIAVGLWSVSLLIPVRSPRGPLSRPAPYVPPDGLLPIVSLFSPRLKRLIKHPRICRVRAWCQCEQEDFKTMTMRPLMTWTRCDPALCPAHLLYGMFYCELGWHWKACMGGLASRSCAAQPCDCRLLFLISAAPPTFCDW